MTTIRRPRRLLPAGKPRFVEPGWQGSGPGLLAILRRELVAYATSPATYVFVAFFVAAAGAFTFHVGRLFDTGRADLDPFFRYHPWLWVAFLPALSMRLWSEEIRSGTLETLLSLGVALRAAVLAKFLAAWLVAGVALMLTFPVWIIVNWLGEPDNGLIATAYLMSLLTAGGLLAIGSAASAATRNAVLAYIVAGALSFILVAAGLPVITQALSGLIGRPATDVVAELGILRHFQAGERGVLDARALIYVFSLIGLGLTSTVLLLDARREG
jgi:ABC-2 type transport system permease protein